MLDTTIYNHILDRSLRIEDLQEGDYFCTQIQNVELLNTSDEMRRAKLINLRDGSERTSILNESFILDFNHLGYFKLGDGVIYKNILDAMNAIKKDRNNPWDAQIAETAALNGMILVTDDNTLFDACQELKIPVEHLDDILIN